MIEHLLAMLGHLGKWNYVVLAALVIVEGPVATLLGSILASVGILKPWAVFVVASTSNMFSDFLWYSLGRFGGQERLKWVLRKAGVREETVDLFVEKVKARSWSIIFTAKVTLSFSIPAFVSAGIAGISWLKVLSALLPAEVLWTGGIVIGGYYFGQFAQQLERGVRIAGGVGGVIFLILAIRYLSRSSGTKVSET